MQVEARKLSSENLDIQKFIIPVPVVYPGSMSDMYSTHSSKAPTKMSMSRMYSIESSLKSETNIQHGPSPKKMGTMFQSMFNAFNGIWEHLSKVPGSFIANVNIPLSVTLVQNEGIISHEFFKSLTSRNEPLPTDNMRVHDEEMKEALGIVERVMFSDRSNQKIQVEEKTKIDGKNSESNIHELVIKNYGDNTRTEKLRVTVTPEETPCNSEENTINYRAEERSCLNDFTEDATELRKRCSGGPTVNDITLCTSTKTELVINSSSAMRSDTDMVQANSKVRVNADDEFTASPKQTIITNLLTNMWQRVVGGVTDRFNRRLDPMEPEVMVKRSVSPKQRRKLNTVAKGRGRGRGKPQLRRSGVSQTRHRKERAKHELEVDIHDDFEYYQDTEVLVPLRRTLSTDSCSFEHVGLDVPDCAQPTVSEIHKPKNFTVGDVKPICHKPKTRKSINQDACKFLTGVRYVPDCTMECDYYDEKLDPQKNAAYRPRLVSESSVDSEDSYCIIFDTEPEMDYRMNSGMSDVSYESDESDDDDEDDEDDNDDDDDDDDDDTDDESVSSAQKVKFDLKPTVHLMVHWAFAYRAARRSPWEEMARDRERFRARIHCIERILKPILSTQHRSHIWQQRFALEE